MNINKKDIKTLNNSRKIIKELFITDLIDTETIEIICNNLNIDIQELEKANQIIKTLIKGLK